MFFSGTNLLVKLHGGPYAYPKVTSTFRFPVSKLQVIIEKGELRYMTSDGAGVHTNPVGFCFDTTAKTYTNLYETESTCVEQGFKWQPYVSITSVTDIAAVHLNNVHLSEALSQMLDYYKEHNVNRQDYMALAEWVLDVKDQASINKTWRPDVGNATGEILDAVAIQFSSEQASSPIYNPGSMLMDTQMRGNTMVNGTVSINYKSEWNKDLLGFNSGSVMDLEIIYNRDEFELDESVTGAQYDYESDAFSYKIHDIEFIGRSHATNPSPENIVENYQFIGKYLTSK
tara:strand:+ start:727 stop:1584 length:858 start_codon:yes stop_codon:yes gene_type:complete